MRQNVSSSAAAVVIVLALVVLFVLFNKPAPPSAGEVVRQLPFEPQVDTSKMGNLRNALKPIGILAVFPPLTQDRSSGVRVAAVVPGRPADRAGLKAGDLITTFNGQKTGNQDVLIYWLAQVDPKKTYVVEFARSGKTHQASLTGLVRLTPEELSAYGLTQSGPTRPSAGRRGGAR